MKFSSVITLSTSRTADPASAGIDRFVGLEHIEPENLHIRSWGLVADGTTFTSTFKRGQVLFAKRRDNDGNLSIPLYVRGKAVGDEKGEYATGGLNKTVRIWGKNSKTLQEKMNILTKMLEGNL